MARIRLPDDERERDEGRLRRPGHGAREDENGRKRVADRRRLSESERQRQRKGQPRDHGLGWRRSAIPDRVAGRAETEELCGEGEGPYTQPLEKEMTQLTRRECLGMLAAGAAVGATAAP